MPFPFGTGELATRIRRALDARGRIPLTFDEVVVPTFLAVDGTRPPFRYSGRRAGAGLIQAAVAGQFARFRLINDTPVDQVLDRVLLVNPTAPGIIWAVGVGAGAAAGGTPLMTTEGIDDPAVAVFRRVGMRLLADTVAATSLAVTFIQGSVSGLGTAGAEGHVDVADMQLVVPANGGTLTIEMFGVNSDARCSVMVNYYDDVGRQGV